MVVAAVEMVAGSHEQQPETPAFEVASVKVNTTTGVAATITSLDVTPGGRFMARNIRLPMLLRMAYGFSVYRMPGQILGPEWMQRERFDIEARSEIDIPPLRNGVPPDALALMLRGLLEDRFNLRVNMESRELPVYALVIARADGRLGSRLRRVDRDCEARSPAGASAPGGSDRRRPDRPTLAWPSEPTCGEASGQGRLMLGAKPIQRLAQQLSVFVDRVVVDRTGLQENFDIELEWAPASSPTLGPGGVAPPVGDLPTLFTAVQEQLGLKLESRRDFVPVLVIDRVERPTEN
jgi:uncharacterized protein (TIGR03435 family)